MVRSAGPSPLFRALRELPIRPVALLERRAGTLSHTSGHAIAVAHLALGAIGPVQGVLAHLLPATPASVDRPEHGTPGTLRQP